MVAAFASLEGRQAPDWFAGHDPEGRPLGSGGGTVHLLVEAWKATGEGLTYREWLLTRRKLILHGGGQSRRLPAYAATGKMLMPLPVFRWERGQRLDQSLLDVQLPQFHRVLRHAPSGVAAMVTSGDVLLRFDADLPQFPDVDVLGLGMWTTPEKASQFGVFFTPRKDPRSLAFFLQKPTPDRIRAYTADHLFLVDTGMWLLSERALGRLMERCGWDAEGQTFRGGCAGVFELYGQLGPSLGLDPAVPDPLFADLTSAVVALPRPEFYHFGTSRQMIESVSALQSRELDQSRLGAAAFAPYPDQHLQNSCVQLQVHRERNSTLWIENSVIPASWRLAREHVLTGVPSNSWELTLERGVCLDFVPIDPQICEPSEPETYAIRCYGIDDCFSGLMGGSSTHWFGRPASLWFERRGLIAAEAGISPDTDIQCAALFPVSTLEKLDAGYLTWLFAANPARSPEHAQRWLRSKRLSARKLQAGIHLGRLYAQRTRLRTESLTTMLQHRDRSVFHRLDLAHTASIFAATGRLEPELNESQADLDRAHSAMFRSAVQRQRGAGDWRGQEHQAFAILREAIVRESQLAPALPRASVVDDQIVWARSPVRLDLAGGWTDTPPFCLEHGGQVVNLAIDINGQPPMQVFARLHPRPEIVLRSIDLGMDERIRTYAELDTFAEPGSSFALAKAACALSGFLPRFHAQGGHGSLSRDLEAFGGGLELSLLSAVPKGSGLGTSSILGATVLGALSQVCGLAWDRATLFSRTLALEQMITTGGGWQDQAGGLFPGLKLIETDPGMTQTPRVRWLPEQLFGPTHANRSILLYYTGLTRLAKGILSEIVRGIFLNSPRHLATLEEIAASARSTVLAIEHRDYPALAESIDLTWRLKQQLDPGTNPAPIQGILEAIQGDLLAAQLPGAGGGGYLLLLARDDGAANRIRRRLEDYPPNPRARFVDFSVSNSGLHVTRS